MIDLSQRVALVTGSSRGIGRATALRLAQAGAQLVLNYSTSQTAARQTAEEVRALGASVALVKADVSQEEDIQAMLAFVEEKYGRLDILVSNVASGGFRPLLEANSRHFEATMNTNVLALLRLVQAAHPLLKKALGRAKVVAMSSHGSHRALPHYALIGASKAALESLIRHMALELGETINFNTVLAGLVETDSTRILGSEAFAQARASQLTGAQLLSAESVADSVLFLASPLSDLIQGQTLIVDGGASLRV